VKKPTIVLGVNILTILYCFTICIIYNLFILNNTQYNSISDNAKQFSSISQNLFCHTPQSENTFNNYNNSPTASYKNSLTDIWATLKATEKLFETEFSEYNKSFRTFLINYRKSDIIFPFNYFW